MLKRLPQHVYGCFNMNKIISLATVLAFAFSVHSFAASETNTVPVSNEIPVVNQIKTDTAKKVESVKSEATKQ